jgi:hypothetical protein
LKHEVPGEALQIAFDLLDQALSLDAVEVRQVFVEHDLPVADDKDPLLDRGRGEDLQTLLFFNEPATARPPAG